MTERVFRADLTPRSSLTLGLCPKKSALGHGAETTARIISFHTHFDFAESGLGLKNLPFFYFSVRLFFCVRNFTVLVLCSEWISGDNDGNFRNRFEARNERPDNKRIRQNKYLVRRILVFLAH